MPKKRGKRVTDQRPSISSVMYKNLNAGAKAMKKKKDKLQNYAKG